MGGNEQPAGGFVDRQDRAVFKKNRNPGGVRVFELDASLFGHGRVFCAKEGKSGAFAVGLKLAVAALAGLGKLGTGAVTAVGLVHVQADKLGSAEIPGLANEQAGQAAGDPRQYS